MIASSKEVLAMLELWEEQFFMDSLQHELELNEIKNPPSSTQEGFNSNNP